MPEAWPALMTRETAAAYCDMTMEQFDRHCPVAPIDQGWKGLRWKRTKLDVWIENLPEKPRDTIIARQAALDAANAPAPDVAPLTPEERRAASLARM